MSCAFTALSSATAALPVDGTVLSVHRATTGDPLTVVRKTSVGRRSDALNAALNVARHPLVCMVDADSLLEPEALVQVARPFVEDPANVVASGGVIRAANGARVARGSVLEPRLSSRWASASRWSSTCARSCSVAPGGPTPTRC
jgi:cellulose synthase/poly-beta-1,6-N-acetylglucosamine synthase-like glycosyltransferase